MGLKTHFGSLVKVRLWSICLKEQCQELEIYGEWLVLK